jgi:hypothetical protein
MAPPSAVILTTSASNDPETFQQLEDVLACWWYSNQTETVHDMTSQTNPE